MYNIGGELAFLLQDIDYNSKAELLDKLKQLKKDLKNYPKEEREKIKPILEISIQQAFYASKWELTRYKEFLKFRSEHERNKKDKSAD